MTGRIGHGSYDDLQVAVSGGRLPPANAATWRTWDYGTGGGINFPVLGFDVGDRFEFFIQTTHKTQLSSVLDHHIHWSIPANSLGDRFQFQLDVIGAPIGSSFATLASSPFTVEYILDGTESGVHKLLDIANLDAINTTVSTCYICILTRIAATTNEYGPEVYVFFTDSHVFQDTAGSITERKKN